MTESIAVWATLVAVCVGALLTAIWVARGPAGSRFPAAIKFMAEMRGASPVPMVCYVLALVAVVAAAKTSHDPRLSVLSTALLGLGLALLAGGTYVFWARPDWATPRWARARGRRKAGD